MAKTFHVTIARVGNNLFDGDAISVTLPGSEGVFDVLAGHEPFVTPLKAGAARVVTEDGSVESFDIETGIAEVSHNQATVLL